MKNITYLPPLIQLTVRYLSGTTLEQLGEELNITKQAVHKKVKQGIAYLKAFQFPNDMVAKSELDAAQQEISRLSDIIELLRRELVISRCQKLLLTFFKAQVRKAFPTFHLSPLAAEVKKELLDLLTKFKTYGGSVREFAKSIEKSPETLSRWQSAFQKYGLSGLVPKRKRPKNFGNKLPGWIKDQLIMLFLQFPRWTPFQYHSYIRHSPIINWYVSIPTIVKLKQTHQQQTQQEKERIKKRWAFAPGWDVWTVDFTCILKTKSFKLQLLTVSDQRSRFLFPTALFLDTSTKLVMEWLQDLFLRFGKPLIIKADNGQEFRIDCKNSLERLSIYLLNNPKRYGQFSGAHERIHRTLKSFIDKFSEHHNLTKLLNQIREFEQQYNYSMTFDGLDGKTPADIYFNDKNFIPNNAEVITPYQKDGELRMKFTNRHDGPARLTLPLLMGTLQKIADKASNS